MTVESGCRGSTLSQSSVPIDLASAKAQIRRTGQQEFHTCYLADPHSATHRTLTGEVRSSTGDSASPAVSVSPSLSWERATLRFWPATYIESDDNSLHCVHTAEAMTRQHSTCSCAVRPSCRHAPPPTTSTPPTHGAWWASWRWLGRWHVPPRPGMREKADAESGGAS